MAVLAGGISPETELLTGLKKSLYERSRFLDPTRTLELIQHLDEWVGEELAFEEGATTSLGRLLSDLATANFVDQIPPLLHSFERLASAYFVRRGSVSGFHSFCNAWREGVVRRTLHLAEEGLELNDLGRPPAPYAILASGSAGRREQTLEDSSRYFLVWEGDTCAYFDQFAYRILAVLDQCGLVGRSASDFLGKVLWRGPLSCWNEWLSGARGSDTDEMHRRLELLADLRPIAGDQGVGERAVRQACAVLKAAPWTEPYFALVHRAVSAPLALTFLGRLRVERVGEHAGSLNVSTLAVRPLVVLLRLLALEHGLEAAPTSERIRQLGDLGVIEADAVPALLEACRFFTAVKIRSEITLQQPYLNPAELSESEMRSLRSGLLAVRQLQRAARRTLWAGKRRARVARRGEA